MGGTGKIDLFKKSAAVKKGAPKPAPKPPKLLQAAKPAKLALSMAIDRSHGFRGVGLLGATANAPPNPIDLVAFGRGGGRGPRPPRPPGPGPGPGPGGHDL